MKDRIKSIHSILSRTITDSQPLLTFDNCYQLLIAVIMSAQTTDAQVNQVTPKLFERFPNPEDLAAATQEEVEEIIHSTGFYRSKARNIRGTAEMLIESYDRKVPDTIDELTKMPGVGRKSANVILGHCFGQPAIIVDTHFGRVVRRIGLTAEKDPGKVEKQLKEIVPTNIQYDFSMMINRHGRQTCAARAPRCDDCAIVQLCDYGKENDRAGS